MATLPRAGMVIVRVWIEDDGTEGFRGRINTSTDLGNPTDSGAPPSTSTAVSSVEDCLDVVRRFLEEFVAGP